MNEDRVEQIGLFCGALFLAAVAIVALIGLVGLVFLLWKHIL
jgi:hypothetical protein